MGRKKKFHWLSWDKLCQPKSESGLGFRNFHAFNLALLAKNVWRLIYEPDSLVAKILKVKYYPTCTILEAKLKPNCSFVWRSICAARVLSTVGQNGLSAPD